MKEGMNILVLEEVPLRGCIIILAIDLTFNTSIIYFHDVGERSKTCHYGLTCTTVRKRSKAFDNTQIRLASKALLGAMHSRTRIEVNNHLVHLI